MTRLRVLLVLLGCATLAACGGSDGSKDLPASSNDAPAQRADSAKVPADLRHLVPLAERWGIGDDLDRTAKVDRATPAERQELSTALAPFHARITAWLDSFGKGAMSDEAAMFMYMQLALDEMMVSTPP